MNVSRKKHEALIGEIVALARDLRAVPDEQLRELGGEDGVSRHMVMARNMLKAATARVDWPSAQKPLAEVQGGGL